MAENLENYKKKRNFAKTSEPIGKVSQSAGRLRFVVQHHMSRNDHYDLRLEWQGILLSFVLPKGPSYNVADKRLAVRVENHPLDYRNFEGNIPKGEYGGGVVMLWDEGYCKVLNDFEKGLEEGSLKFILLGKRLKGKWALIKLKSIENTKDDVWIFIKEKDKFSKATPSISMFDTSVRTGRTMKEIEENKSGKKVPKKKQRNPFSSAAVMLAKSETKFPKDGNWVYEVKYDGYRIIAYIETGKVRLMTRNEIDYTSKFSEIVHSLQEWAGARAMVLDGEMVVVDEKGKSDFAVLQNHIKKSGGNLTYIIFDLLAYEGEDIREKRLTERKEILRNLLNGAPSNLYYSNHVEERGEECFWAASKSGLEGIIGKKAESPYSGSRSGDWIKIKCENRQEFIICGYIPSDKKSDGLGAIILGYYKNKELTYAGRVGTGFSEISAKELLAKFEKLQTDIMPFKNISDIGKIKRAVWIKPKLIAEVKFTEWTNDGILRHPSFKGLRIDKKAHEIIKEKSNDFNCVREKTKNKQKEEKFNKNSENFALPQIITSPQKLMFCNPNVTKIKIAEYYLALSKRMLPYLEKRVLSLVCCPKGVSGSCFFKKHNLGFGDGTGSIKIKNSKGEIEEYFYITSSFGLINMVQNNTIEFHTWSSCADSLDRPDIMVFDLDPDEGMDLKQIRQGVKDLKNILDGLNLKSYLKTSGGKGYHIVVPFRPLANFENFRNFAKSIAMMMEQKWSDRYTSNVRKEKRNGKIFIDWIRNGKGATSIAPYSLRAREGGKVSMPLDWSELNKVAPDGIDMDKAIKRLSLKDPWHDFFVVKQEQSLTDYECHFNF